MLRNKSSKSSKKPGFETGLPTSENWGKRTSLDGFFGFSRSTSIIEAFTADPLESPPDFTRFTPDTLPFLSPGVYRYFTEDGTCIYVGQSKCMRRRYHEHAKSKAWFKDVAYADGVLLADAEGQLVLETIEILRLRPRWNRAIKLGITNDGRIYPLNFLRGKRG